jgi:hypothetical protein
MGYDEDVVVLVRTDASEERIASMIRGKNSESAWFGAMMSEIKFHANTKPKVKNTAVYSPFSCLLYLRPIHPPVRFEVFTAVTMKSGVFWDVMPCGSCKNRFGGT